MTNVVAINRPHVRSFTFEGAPYSSAKLDQVHKLARNYAASLELGCASAKHVRDYPGMRPGMDQRELYQLWVANWKVVYRSVSATIRQLKTYRRTVRFPTLTAEQQRMFWQYNAGSNQQMDVALRELAHHHLPRLQETAMVLLNARHNAKLASAEARRRAKLAA